MSDDVRRAIGARDLERLRDAALALADAARARLRALQAGEFEVKRKTDGSFVTSADIDIEQQLRNLVEQRFPEHGIQGEELPARAPQAEFQWIFDPIDGTEDFVQRMPTFGCIIGLYYRGEPLVGVIDIPMLGLRLHAAYSLGTFDERGRVRLPDLGADVPLAHTRLMLAARANFINHSDDGHRFDAVTRHYPNHRIYRSCYAHLCTIRGQADAMLEYGNRIWDLAATRILAEEAGGAYRLVQKLATETGPVFGAVFGKPLAVERLCMLLDESDR